MGIDVAERGLLLAEMAEAGEQDEMLEDIRVVARVVGVSVAEHGRIIAENAGLGYRTP
jgi:hypothetical protein